MDIQQWEKEPLDTYVHRFKTEAKRCNFTNDAATIRIFVKGLKNAYSLATHNYEKGPQMLTDTISEVEKLNAAQKLTAMIIPHSTVNVMSNEEDCCFQCQKLGHITWHCPHNKCYKCDKYGHIVMDCPHKIPPSGTQQLTTNLTEVTMPDQVWGITMKIGTDEVDPDHTPTTKDITAWAIAIHIQAALGHYIRKDTTTTGVAHDDLTQSTEVTATTIGLTVTHHIDHITVLHNIKALQATDPEITVGHIHDHLTDL